MGLTGGQHGRRTDGVRGHPRSWWVKLGRWPPPPLLLCVAFFLFCLRTYSYNTVFAFVLQVAKQMTLFFFVGLIGAVFVYVFFCTYHTYSYSILIRFAGCEKRFSFFFRWLDWCGLGLRMYEYVFFCCWRNWCGCGLFVLCFVVVLMCSRTSIEPCLGRIIDSRFVVELFYGSDWCLICMIYS